MTFLPVAGAAIILMSPAGRDTLVKTIAAVASFLPVLLAVQLWFLYDRRVAGVSGGSQFQFVEHYRWIPSINVEYFLGADGISMPMIMLTTIVSFLAVVGSWGIEKQIKGYMALILLLETGMMGVFCALDFFLFYVFWEVMLLPMYFLIGIWGGPRREYAAIKFFLFTMAGSVLMLLGMLALFFEGGKSFDMLHLARMGAEGHFTGPFWTWVWWGLFIAFIVKVPSVPVHTWLPDAHV